MNKLNTLMLGSLCMIATFEAPNLKAETLTITAKEFETALPPASLGADDSEQLEFYTGTFVSGQALWQVLVSPVTTFETIDLRPKYSDSSKYTYTETFYNEAPIMSMELKTSFFNDKNVLSVRIDGAVFSSISNDDATETYKLQIGNYNTSKEIPQPKKYLNNGITPQEFTLNPAVQGDLSLHIYAAEGGRIAFRSLEIEYVTKEVAKPAEVSSSVTIPVGHPIELNANKEATAVYYTIDGTENWLEYNALKGIVFEEPGDYTIKYCAENADGVLSAVKTERVSVSEHKGFNAALYANREIEVSGIVVKNTDNYTLIADTADAGPDECLALDNSEHPRLRQATAGDNIVATGRPTERFGSGIKALGSLTSVSINGETSVSTNISAVMTQLENGDELYDLAGRKLSNQAKNRVVISSKGNKFIAR